MKASFDRRDLMDAAASRLRFPSADAKRIRTTVEIWTADTAAAATPEGM